MWGEDQVVRARLLQAGGDGTSIVTDPYKPETSGLDPVREPADLVIMSSTTDEYHSEMSMVPGDPLYLNAMEATIDDAVEVRGVRVETFPPGRAWSKKKIRRRTPCTALSWTE